MDGPLTLNSMVVISPGVPTALCCAHTHTVCTRYDIRDPCASCLKACPCSLPPFWYCPLLGACSSASIQQQQETLDGQAKHRFPPPTPPPTGPSVRAISGSRDNQVSQEPTPGGGATEELRQYTVKEEGIGKGAGADASSDSVFLQCAFYTPVCIVFPSHFSLKLCAFEWLQCSSSWWWLRSTSGTFNLHLHIAHLKTPPTSPRPRPRPSLSPLAP